MKIITTIQNIHAVIPETKRKSFRKFLYGAVVFSFLDLISIAYLVPAILILLDKNKLATYFKEQQLPIDILSPNTLLFGVLLLVVFYVIKNLLQAQYNVRLYRFLYDLSHALSMDILEKYLNGDYLSFQEQEKGALIQNTTTATRDFATSLLASLLLLVSESLTFISILMVLLICYFKLTLVVLMAIGFFALLIFKLKKAEMNLINTTYKEASSKANAELLNILDGYIEIKSAGNQQSFLSKFKTHNQSLNRVTSLLTSSSSNYSKYLELFLIIGIAGLIFYNFFSTGNGENFVLISVLAALSIKIVPSLSKILNAITMVNAHFYSVAILQKAQKANRTTTVYSKFENHITFRDIAFEYNNKIPVFEGINFTIKRGDIIGIKGITGAGKTTFLHLVAGLLMPNKGSITIDNQPVKSHPFFPFISYVAQQPFLFHGSLLENITMRQTAAKIDFEYIDYLLENLELKELIQNQSHGLETIIQHNTAKLSGGQKQRLALLRALYQKPQLLILDEATNQQNEELEIKLYDFIRKIAASTNMAVLIVSHNPAINSFCEQTYVLEKSSLSITRTQKSS
ncbi:ABC transporter ATP-binding protein [Flavobacterium sp.]|uniref:ABC transporter ATP-binding protein n=1 Tax=Flavobacterium sp. TaxID=239 RepID=UPI00286B2DF6|nr:ABC transporter ATP-binding protein [Flavobacterium sp.]